MFEFRLVVPWDPAVDREAMREARPDEEQWNEFLETLHENVVIPFDGELPQVFVGRPLTRKEIRELDALPMERKRERAFAVSIAAVHNKRYRDGSQRLFGKARSDRPMGDSELDQFSENERQQIGQAVLTHSFCASGEPVCVPLLASSQHALLAAGIVCSRRRAEQTKAQAAALSGAVNELPKAPQ